MFEALDSHGNLIQAHTLREATESIGKYFCPDCRCLVVPKPGITVSAHFAHKDGGESCKAAFESRLHLRMKSLVVADLTRHGHTEVSTERTYENLRPDVSFLVSTKSGAIRVGIECQASDLDPASLLRKLDKYARNRISALFLVSTHLIGLPDGYEYKIPAWARLLHGIYKGRIYVIGSDSRFYPCHLQWQTRTYKSIQFGEAQCFDPKRFYARDMPGTKLPDQEYYEEYAQRHNLNMRFLIAHFGDKRFWESW